MSVVATLRLGVTGTDTNVGKTVVSCALLSALRERGLIARGMKPVETGVLLPRAPGTDAACLRRAAGDVDAWEDVCPATYAEPLAPMVAAERAERPLDLAAMDAAAARLGDHVARRAAEPHRELLEGRLPWERRRQPEP
ncbi:MAG: ATP-dependent dethiobiotin synthetase BioD, partial [Gemmatirosa sp.]